MAKANPKALSLARPAIRGTRVAEKTEKDNAAQDRDKA